MAAEAVFQVTPNEGSWRIDRDGTTILEVQSKDVAIEEAVVQARREPQSRVVVRGADGSVEDEAVYQEDVPAQPTGA